MAMQKGLLGIFKITFKFFKWVFLIMIFPITLIVWIVKRSKKKKIEKAEEERAAAQSNGYNNR